MLTNEIYKAWCGMKDDDYKTYKGLRKESLRDNMADLEVSLSNIGEITIRDIARKKKSKGLKENLEVARLGGGLAKGTRDLYKNETKRSVVSTFNNLKYEYVDNTKQIAKK